MYSKVYQWQYKEAMPFVLWVGSVMGCPKDTSTGLEGLFNFQVHEAEKL